MFYKYTFWLYDDLKETCSWQWWWKRKGEGGFASSRSNCITVCLLWITNCFPCISFTHNFPIQVHDHVQASMSCTCPSVAYQYENVFSEQQWAHLCGVIYLQIGRVYFFSRRVPKFPTIWDLGFTKFYIGWSKPPSLHLFCCISCIGLFLYGG